MPPLYPRAPEPEYDDEEVAEDCRDDKADSDDDVLDNVSVAMVHRNEQGEFDVETVVEGSNPPTVELTMSI